MVLILAFGNMVGAVAKGTDIKDMSPSIDMLWRPRGAVVKLERTRMVEFKFIHSLTVRMIHMYCGTVQDPSRSHQLMASVDIIIMCFAFN
jgi:hypothetical protein